VNFSEMGRVIEQLGKDRGIKKDVIVGAIEQAFLVTARKKFGIQGNTKQNIMKAMEKLKSINIKLLLIV